MKKTTTKENIELALQYAKINAQLKRLEEEKAELRAKIEKLMGEDSILFFGDEAQAIITDQSRDSYDYKAMRVNGVDVDAYKKTTTFKMLKLITLKG